MNYYHGNRYERRLAYAQRDLAPSVGAGLGVILVALVLTLATCARLAWMGVRWACKKAF